MTATTASGEFSTINQLGDVVVQIMLIVISHVVLSFGSGVKEPDVEILLVKLGVLAQDLRLGSFGSFLDLLGMLVFEADVRRIYRAFRIGSIEVSIVGGHVNAAKITLQVAALRAGHLVTAIAFDEVLLAFVAVTDESLASGFLDSVAMAESRLFVSLSLVLLAGIGNMRLFLAFATAGDFAGRRLTMELEVNVDG